MRRAALYSCIVAATAACADGPSAPHQARPDAVRGPALAAVTETSSTSVPIDLGVFIPCANGGAGENVALTGDLHLVTSATISQTGNVTLRSLAQPQGISGTGAITGDKYQATGGTQETYVSNGPLPLSDTYVNNFRIIGSGSDNNILIHETFHVTINADGVVTASVDKLSVECR